MLGNTRWSLPAIGLALTAMFVSWPRAEADSQGGWGWGIAPTANGIGVAAKPTDDHVRIFGDASWVNIGSDQDNYIARLTPGGPGATGAAWFVTGGQLQVATGFQVDFTFRITSSGGLGGLNGGDGFAFVVNGSQVALGYGGGYLGYTNVPSSLAVEFDTYPDPLMFGDPPYVHLGVLSRGTQSNSADHRQNVIPGSTTAPFPPGINIRDGQDHWVRVIYDAAKRRMDTYIDSFDFNTAATTRGPILSVPVDLGQLIGLNNTAGKAWLGFTGATGSAWENHDVTWFWVGPFNPG